MNQIVVTFYWQEEVNNKISVEIRGKLEGLSDKWVQVFPNRCNPDRILCSRGL